MKRNLSQHAAAMEKEVQAFTEQQQGLLHVLRSAPRAAGAPGAAPAAPARTCARPMFEESDPVINPYQNYTPPDSLTLEEFQTSMTCLRLMPETREYSVVHSNMFVKCTNLK